LAILYTPNFLTENGDTAMKLSECEIFLIQNLKYTENLRVPRRVWLHSTA